MQSSAGVSFNVTKAIGRKQTEMKANLMKRNHCVLSRRVELAQLKICSMIGIELKSDQVGQLSNKMRIEDFVFGQVYVFARAMNREFARNSE